MKKWYNVEVSNEVGMARIDNFKAWMHAHDVKFETSEAGTMAHFEILTDEPGGALVNGAIDEILYGWNYVYSRDMGRWVKRPNSWMVDGDECDYYTRDYLEQAADDNEWAANLLADYPTKDYKEINCVEDAAND